MIVARFVRSFRPLLCMVFAAWIASPALAADAPSKAQRLEFTEATITGDQAIWKLEKYGLEPRKTELATLSLRQPGVRPKTEGTATTLFNGNEGYYTLTVEYLDKASGTTRMALRVDDKQVSRWNGENVFGNLLVRQVVPHVYLRRGSAIQIWGRCSGYDYAGINALEITPGQAEPPAPVVPPAKVYSNNLVPAAERIPCVDPTLMIPLPQLTWPDAGTPTDVNLVPAFLFRAKKGERFEAQVENGAKDLRQYVWAIRQWPADGKATPAGTLDVPAGLSGRIRFDVPQDAIFELRLGGAVRAVTHPLTRHLTGDVREAHFLVPAGTEAFTLKGPVKKTQFSSILLRDSEGAIVWRGDLAANAEKVIAVPKAKAGTIWHLRSENDRGAFIAGIPPYGAMTPAHLLAPAEALPAGVVSVKPSAMPLSKPRALAATAAAPGLSAVPLVRDGLATSVIVTPHPGPESLELQRVIQQISGAIVPVVDKMPATGAAIVLGTIADYPDAPQPAGFEQFNPEGVFIRTTPDRIYIIGRSDRAILPGVYTFLRQLGCRWYLGSGHWDFLPDARDITVAIDLKTQPDFLRRAITQGTKVAGGIAEMDQWCRQNRMGGSIRGSIHHSYSSFVTKELAKERPEYFAMKDTNNDGVGDTRTDIQPCTTHPEVIKLFLDGAIKAFEKDPELDLLAVSPNDGTINMCRCDRCQKLGSYSDCAWTLAHQCADAVRARFPGRKIWIGFYAYGVVSIPPTLKGAVDPDIAIEIATAYNKVSVEQMFESWPQHVGAIGVREYFAIPQWGANLPGKGITVSKAARIIPAYKAQKAIVLNAEASPSWGGAGLGMYLAAQLMWDSSQEPEAVLEDFYTTCFGAAAKPMRRYFERWDRERFDSRTAKMALQDLREAMLAADTVQARRHVSLYALYIHYTKLSTDWNEISESASKEETVRLMEQTGNFLWRIRNHGMLRLSAVSGAVYPGLEYFTYDEVMKLVDEDLRTLEHQKTGELITQYKSSFIPLPAQAIGQHKSNAGWAAFKSQTWVISDEGRNIVINASGKGGQLTAQLLSSAGTLIEKKELKLAGESDDLRFTLPQPGQYRINIVAENVKYRIAAPTRSSAMVLREKNREWFKLLLPAEIPETYFYVPVGAEAVVLGFAAKADPKVTLEIVDNKGNIVIKAQPNPKTRELTLPTQILDVPPGNDNQLWCVRVSGPIENGSLTLQGLPPFVQTNPGQMLIPDVGDEEGAN